MKKLNKRNIKKIKKEKLIKDNGDWNKLKKDYSYNFKSNEEKINHFVKKKQNDDSESINKFTKRYIFKSKKRIRKENIVDDFIKLRYANKFNLDSNTTSSILYKNDTSEDNGYIISNSTSEDNGYFIPNSENKINYYSPIVSTPEEEVQKKDNPNLNYYDFSLTNDDKLRYEKYKSDLRNNPYIKGKNTGSNFTKQVSRKSLGFTKYLTREMIVENQQEDSLRKMKNFAYKGATRGKLAYNIGGRVVDLSAVALTLPLTLYSKNQKNKKLNNSNLNNINYHFIRHRSVSDLKKSISENKVGELYSNKKLWKMYLKDNQIGLIKFNRGKLEVNKIKNIKSNTDYLIKKRAIKKYKHENKILNKRLDRKKNVKQLTKIVAFDNLRSLSNQFNTDNQNIGLSGLDTAFDIYRDSYKFTKYTTKGGLKVSGKSLKAGSKVTKGGYKKIKKLPKNDFSIKNHLNKYKKIYKENNFKTAFKTAFKDIVINIVSSLKRVVVMLFKLIKSAIIYALGLFTSTIIPTIMIITLVSVCILSISRIYPMTIVNSFDDSMAGQDGEDIKDMFDCVRDWNGEFATYGDIVVYEGNPDNAKALISITSRYFDNDMKNRQNVYDYLAYLHDISHVVTIEYIEIPDDTNDTDNSNDTNDTENSERPIKIIKKATVKTEEDFKQIINSIKDGSASTKDDTDHLENGMRMIKDNYINKVLGSNSLAQGSYTEDTSANASTNVQEAFTNIANEKKLTASEVQQWKYIISRESGWSVTATNPSSGAYGLGQAYPAEKMAPYGSDYRTNPTTQLRWMYDYMLQAYGSITNAYNFWVKNHWY